MFDCDLHVHSIRSTCGFHTLLEIVEIVKKKGLKAFALTDHSPIHKTPLSHFSVLLRRMPETIDGIRVLKGIESTVLTVDGKIDLPVFPVGRFDVVLAGLHDFGDFSQSRGEKENTAALINVMKRYPEVKVITHPFFSYFPLDMDALTDAACETGKALEINNSYILTGKADMGALEKLVRFAGEKGTILCVNSDGHLFNEIGEFGLALDYLSKSGLDNFNIANRTFGDTMNFLGIRETV